MTGPARFAPSPIFVAIVAVTVALGALLWQQVALGGAATFLFVLAGWILSLTLHEFGHAALAYVGGDRSVAAKGYLTLDVRRYVDPGTSLVFPLLILMIGGIGLPGGAVWINTGALRSPAWRSAVSAAGPAATLVCALVCLLPIRLGLLDGAPVGFVVALGFLGWIQVIALILNLLPIPGLDGYGIIEPHLSTEIRTKLRPLYQYGFLGLFLVLFLVEPVGDAFWRATDRVARLIGGGDIDLLRAFGWNEFRFWL